MDSSTRSHARAARRSLGGRRPLRPGARRRARAPRRGVELVTSRFVHGPRAAVDGYELDEPFYRLATGVGARAAAAAARAQARRARAGHAALPPPRRGRRRAPLPVAAARAARRAGCCRPPGRACWTVHNVVRQRALEPAAGARRWTRWSCTPAAARSCWSQRTGVDPARIHVIPHGAFAHLAEQAGRGAAAARAGGRRGPGRPLLRRGAAVQGRRGAAGRLPRRRARRGAVGRRPAAGRVDRRAARARRAARGCASCPATSATASCRRCCAAPTCWRCRTSTSTCPACCSPGWRSARRWLLSDVGGFAELAREHGIGRLVAPGDAERWAPRSASCCARPEERGGAGAGRARGGGGPVLVGPDRRADAGAVPGARERERSRARGWRR